MPKNPTKPNPIYLIYMYKEDLALNNPQWLICHKTRPKNVNEERDVLFFLNFFNSIKSNCCTKRNKSLVSGSFPPPQVSDNLFYCLVPESPFTVNYTKTKQFLDSVGVLMPLN